MHGKLEKFLFVNILLFILFTAFCIYSISYHPSLKENVVNESNLFGNGPRSTLLWVGLSLVLLVTFSRILHSLNLIIKITFLKCYLVCTIIIILLMTIYPIQHEAYYMAYSFLLTILGMTMSSYVINMRPFLVVFVIISLTIGFFNLGTLQISVETYEDKYLMSYKNTFCLIFAISAIIGLCLSLSTKNIIFSLIYFVLSVLSIFIIALSRGRSALLSTICCITLILIKKYYVQIRTNPINLFLGILVLGMTIIVCMSSNIYDIFHGSFSGGRQFYNLDDFSSGRITILEIGLDALLENPFFGNKLCYEESQVPTHMFFMTILVNYGLFGGIYMIFMYIYILMYVLKNSLSPQIISLEENIGFYAMFILLFGAVFEATYPFGGVATVPIAFFLFGTSLGIHLIPKNKYQPCSQHHLPNYMAKHS